MVRYNKFTLGGGRLGSEVKNEGGARSGKKRVAAMAVMLLLLIMSSLSILIFFLNVETKKTPHGAADAGVFSADISGDSHIMPLGAEEMLSSSDTLPRRRQLLTDELNSLLAGTESRTGGNVSWIYDKTTPSALMTSNFYVYLGRNDDALWGRLFAGYIHEAPVSANRLVIDIDGTIYDIGIKYSDRGQRYLDYIGETHEFVDMPAGDYADILRHVGNGRNVQVCFRGDENEHRFRLTTAQIDAAARMMRILRISEELDEPKHPAQQ
jgi:hypothetical protein